MNHSYSNLQEKTFLDFTVNENIIEMIIGDVDKDNFRNNVSEYGRYSTFLEFAEITQNKLLEEEVENQLGGIANE